MYPEHPPAGFHHPWTDPYAPADPLSPRPPDWAFDQQGPLPAPRPEDFPFTAEGRRDYHVAVEQAATMNAMLQQHQMAMVQRAGAAALTEETTALLLLLP